MTADGSTIRILIAYQQALLREAVRVVLSSEDDLAVVGEAPDGKHAIVEAERLRPDVALIDVHFPTRDGIRAVRAITEAIPSCRVIVFSAEEDEQLLIEAMEAGGGAHPPGAGGPGAARRWRGQTRPSPSGCSSARRRLAPTYRTSSGSSECTPGSKRRAS